MKIPFNKTKAIVFDFDGTIADSMGFLEDLAVRVLKKHLPSYSRPDLRQKYIDTTGLPFCEQVGIFLPDEPPQKREVIIDEFEQRKKDSILQQPLFSDAEEMIQYLYQNNYKVNISSSSLKETIEQYFDQYDLLKYITIVCGYRKGFEKGEDHFNFIIDRLNLNKEDLVFVGDSLKDKKRARHSNIPFIGKIGMFTHEQFNDEHKCPTVKSLHELKIFY